MGGYGMGITGYMSIQNHYHWYMLSEKAMVVYHNRMFYGWRFIQVVKIFMVDAVKGG
jgi:hypothetical protein